MVEVPRGEVIGTRAAAAELLRESPPAPGPEMGGRTGPGEETWEEMIAQLLGVWNGLAQPRAPIWVFHPREIEALSNAWAPVARKYGGPSLSIEAAAVMVTLGVALPRVMASKKAKRKIPTNGRIQKEDHEENHQAQELKEEHQAQSIPQENPHASGGIRDELRELDKPLGNDPLPGAGPIHD